jgi:hypothetical protein
VQLPAGKRYPGPEWFAMAAPYGQQFPGLAPAQDQPLTEAGA